MTNTVLKKKIILITRPEPWASITARSLEAEGFYCKIYPLTCYVPLAVDSTKINFSHYGALILTSATIFHFLTTDFLQKIRKLPLYIVGENTEKMANKFKFSGPIFTYRDVNSLTKALSTLPKQNFLYLAGKKRYSILESALNFSNHQLNIIEIYDTKLNVSAINAKQNLHCDIILILSSFSSQALNSIENLLPPQVKILCFSERIYKALSPFLQKKAIYADAPTAAALYKKLSSF